MVNIARRFGLEQSNGTKLTDEQRMERGLRVLWRVRVAILVVDVLALVSIWLAASWVVKAVREEGDHTRATVLNK